MKLDVLTALLTDQLGLRKDGDALVVPGEAELTLFVDMAGDTLTVPRVRRLEFADNMLLADAGRSERYVFGCELVRAVKLDLGRMSQIQAGAGFGK